MKKTLGVLFIILAMLVLFGYHLGAQTTTTTTEVTEYVTDRDAEKLLDKYSSKIENNIKELAHALKTPAEHVYKVLIKQQLVISISYTLVLLLSILLCITGIKLGITADWQEPNKENLGGLALILTFGIISILFLAQLDTIIMGFINPEYGALQEIVNFVK